MKLKFVGTPSITRWERKLGSWYGYTAGHRFFRIDREGSRWVLYEADPMSSSSPMLGAGKNLAALQDRAEWFSLLPAGMYQAARPWTHSGNGLPAEALLTLLLYYLRDRHPDLLSEGSPFGDEFERWSEDYLKGGG